MKTQIDAVPPSCFLRKQPRSSVGSKFHDSLLLRYSLERGKSDFLDEWGVIQRTPGCEHLKYAPLAAGEVGEEKTLAVDAEVQDAMLPLYRRPTAVVLAKHSHPVMRSSPCL